MNNNKKVVYVHIDNNNQPFHVGAGDQARSRSTWRNKEWQAIAKNGYTIEIVKDNLTNAEAGKLETETILKYGLENLTNKRLGGGGLATKSLAARAKISKARTGKKHSAETRAKLVKANLGKVVSVETKAKMAESKFKRQLRDRMTGKIYPSVKAAALELDIKYSTLMAQLRGRGRTTTLSYCK